MKAVFASLLAVGVVALTLMVFARHHATLAAPPPAEALPVVAVVKAERRPIERSVEITAELQPYLQINVFAKIPGYLKTIGVDVGSRVRAGEVIAHLESPEEEADVARAQTTFDEEKLDYDRVQTVVRQHPGLLAQDEVDKAQTAYDVARANLDHAKVMESYATITAPFDGIVTKRTADPGALIQAGTSSAQALPLVHITEDDRLRLILPIPEQIVPEVKVGTIVTVTVPAIHKVVTAPVARCSGQIDNATRTEEVEVDLSNPDFAMTPGMYATASIRLARHDAALTVPVQAIGGKDSPDVWVVGADGKIEDRTIKTGIQTPDNVEILSGLEPGEGVVFGSRNAASPGMRVQPQLMKGTQ